MQLEKLCMDHCQNISPDKVLRGHPNLQKLSINICFQFKLCHLQQLCVSDKKIGTWTKQQFNTFYTADSNRFSEQFHWLEFRFKRL